MINIQKQFSKNANDYDHYNIIQKKVLKELLNKITNDPQCILDIGCGSGSVYRSITWDMKKFVAVDFAEGMLQQHPKNENIELHMLDFNQKGFLEKIRTYHPDRIISSSALQWADDLESIFHQISRLNAPVSFAIFTSGTFKNLA